VFEAHRGVLQVIILCFLYSFAQEDSLPPLPNPYDLELKLTRPREKLKLADTAELSLLGGLVYSSPMRFALKNKLVVPIRFRNKFLLLAGGYISDIDYEPYRSLVALGNLWSALSSTRNAFFKNSLALERKDRLSAFFERIIFTHWSVHPFFFGELNPQLDFRFSRYFRYRHYPFYNLQGQNNYIIPTVIGNLGVAGAFLIQSNTTPIGSVRAFDHIILKEFVFLKPQIGYWFDDRILSFGVNSGARIKKTVVFFQFAYNEKQLLSFDSIYSDVGPLRVQGSLHYPIDQLSLKISILTNNQEIGLCARFDKNQIHFVPSDSAGELLFYPENSGRKSAYFNLIALNNLRIALSSLENRLMLELNPNELSLVPIWAFSDYLTVSVKQFGFTLQGELIGERKCAGHKLNPVFRLDCFVQNTLYLRRSSIVLKIGFQNILGTVWEVYPDYKENHRKLLLEVSLKRLSA